MESRVRTGNFKDDKSITLDIPKGWQLCVIMSTQAAYSIRVKIGENGQYFYNEIRSSINLEPIKTSVFSSIPIEKPKLYIDIAQSTALDCRFSEMKINNSLDELIAISYTIFAEDAVDEDYNDLMLHINAWRERQ